jgi:hypothetical protein
MKEKTSTSVVGIFGIVPTSQFEFPIKLSELFVGCKSSFLLFLNKNTNCNINKKIATKKTHRSFFFFCFDSILPLL